MTTRSTIAALLLMANSLLVVVPPSYGAEPAIEEWTVQCRGAYDLCGFVNSDTGAWTIDAAFEQAFPFSEGLAAVKIDGKFGFIGTSGRTAIAPTFDLAGSFKNGSAEVLVSGKIGLIGKDGSYRLPPEFARAVPFGTESALVAGGAYQNRYMMGRERLTVDSSTFSRADREWSLVDLGSRRTLKLGIHVHSFDNSDLIWASIKGHPRIGLLSTDGSWKLPPTFARVNGFSSGRATACLETGDRTISPGTLSCVSVDREGKVVANLSKYENATYKNGLYHVIVENQKAGLLDGNGMLLVDRYFDRVNIPETGDIVEVLVDGRWQGLTRKGDIVASPREGSVIGRCENGLEFVSSNGEMRVVGPDGEDTVPYTIKEDFIRKPCQFPMVVGRSGKWGFIDQSGKLLGATPWFENTYTFIDGAAAVLVTGKWGILGSDGEFRVQPRYDELSPDAGTYRVRIGQRRFWVDSLGREIPEPIRQVERDKRLDCRENVSRKFFVTVAGERRWGLADAAGRTIIQPKYRAVSCFENGLAWVPFDDSKEWCPIDKSGRRRTDAGCVTNWIASQIADAGPEKMSDDPYESGVLWMRADLDYGAGLRTDPPRIVGFFRRQPL